MHSRIPALGPRGEGWVVAQLVLFAIIAISGLRAVADGPPDQWGSVGRLAGVALVAGGGLLAVRGAWDLRSTFSAFPRPVADSTLVQTGAYRLIRHPIYSGLVLASIGWGIASGSLIAIAGAILLFLLFDGKSRREEVWLVEVHPDYRAYQARTKRLIPWLY